VASCIPAAIKYLEDIYHSGVIDISKEDNYDEEEDEEEKLVLTKEDLVLIKEIVEYTTKLNEPDSKTTKFLEEIMKIQQNGKIKRLIVFSFFKRTLKYLERKLHEIGIFVYRMDGDVPFDERETLLRHCQEIIIAKLI